MYYRQQEQVLIKRIQDKRRFIQALAGPRQTGKTTLAHQAAKSTGIPHHYASADIPGIPDAAWIKIAWETARTLLKSGAHKALLILDEIQKIEQWSTIVKAEWDADTRHQRNLQVIILGSAPLLIQQGLTESLAGRFELISVRPWSYLEMKNAFGWSLEQYVYYGGYPGSAPLIEESDRWLSYIRDSLIETTLSRDILLLNIIQKPALLRRLFQLGCEYSGQILSYQKMLGQLHDAGNTTTLAHYLQLLSGSGMITGVEKYYGKKIMRRSSSPKLLALNTALISANNAISFEAAIHHSEYWGRLVESTIGAHLMNHPASITQQVYYWRDGNDEVDFIIENNNELIALEVKSGRQKSASGLIAFSKKFPTARLLQIGGDNAMTLENFLTNGDIFN
ncbi:MAG: AAA family ATPase [Gammaproteobacteria bacterium RIFCSPLOWO2_02_FULL_42_14]|nr:MAG: AAA family ATPase [Gammaproteobacteria bacterium RIFCSPHIGHO2_02_FULL_42_43]OGT28733.1 MAG: AAA family ATPase [Gammaproteobacteria bacterium RIFCSPHIGHO2_01_FULL_42_8]OGT52161.1 MAG: AAA family ATPase [Gammaproteobacteria bacterium RIFCSPHIGHO2_12_FULL_41_25]OGT62599.1 MAG: AAA family ATPase [Gammaproteobacteria bacterium RIFCSPLOWO2_02_FULL_42_14]OGT86581.1 MAG: AAA family ATPase [Gammaproteobacteria bacterium RIFCSPLOWO2_12_FULL_42_18]